MRAISNSGERHDETTVLVVGKSGAAHIQDLGRGGLFLDENTVMPRSLVSELQSAGFALPANTVKGYSGADAVTLASGNGNPTARAGYITFNTTAYDPNGAIAISSRDPTDTTQGAPEDAAQRYMMEVFTQYILPQKKPVLSLVWFRTPDNAEHGYGPGTANVTASLRSQDARLGKLIAGLRAQGLEQTTNVIVVSDHGHSSVSGPLGLYPLRSITPSTTLPNGTPVNGATSGASGATLGAVATSGGYSFSGDVRSADLLTYRGFKAYDGSGCATDSMFGLTAAGVPTVPVKLDTTGALCGTANSKYQAVSATLTTPVASFLVPAPGSLPVNGVVVAANGGSDYFYVPSHDAATVANLVKFLQQREEYGAIFVDSRYGALPGTLTMAQVNLENATRQNNGQPDVVVSFNWDDSVSIQGMPGIEFESFGAGQRGMHGSFGTTDVHNTLIANGPSFRTAQTVTNPTGNVDVAPTVAHVLGLSLPQADGRILNEALAKPASSVRPTVATSTVSSSPASGLSFELPTDPSGQAKDAALTAGTYAVRARREGPDGGRQDVPLLRLRQGGPSVMAHSAPGRPARAAPRRLAWPRLRRATLLVAAALPLVASAAGLPFEQVFSDRGEPPVIHYRAEFTSGGVRHRVEVWRDGARRLKRRTDDTLETYVVRAPGDAEFRMSVLDLRRLIHTRVDRTNLYRLGTFVDWFDLAHGLKHPMAAYQLVSARAPQGVDRTLAPCRWFELTQESRITHLCWSTADRLPLVIEERGAIAWRVTAVDLKPLRSGTFDIHDQGFIRNDANEDIERDQPRDGPAQDRVD